MTMTSLNVREPAGTRINGETAGTVCDKEVQRMKNFVGRRRFHAPVADDFARGMVASVHDPMAETKAMSPMRGALASVILGLKGLCCSSTLDGQPARNAAKLD